MGKLTKPGLSWQWLSSAVSARIAVKRSAGGSAADRSRASGRPLPDVRSYHPVSTAVPSGFDVPWLPVSHHPEERGFASLAPIILYGLDGTCYTSCSIYTAITIYMQVVWDISNRLGCGAKYCNSVASSSFGSGTIVVCQYGPG